MIQFNRYKLPDESYDFNLSFIGLCNAIMVEINGNCDRSIGLLMSMSERYPGNERLAAVAARLYFWGKVSWSFIEKMMPEKLPSNFLYKQELVGCLGFEQASRKWRITEDDWDLYQGFTHDTHFQKERGTQQVRYCPRNSGFFSVVENIAAAQILAEMEGKQLLVDLNGNWWGYKEPFEEIFNESFEFTRLTNVPEMSFDYVRNVWLNPTDEIASYLADMKLWLYTAIIDDISKFAPSIPAVDSSGVMFVRGGDKLQTETILPPVGLIQRELRWMSRRCEERYILSDDKDLGERYAALDAFAINNSDQVEGGYHHRFGQKVSCLPILKNFMYMVEAKENFSCPSSNIVNAANWSRNDGQNYSLSNPVYRYLLI